MAKKKSDIVLLCMNQLSVWFDDHVVRLTYIDVNMDIVYL